jgi:hypothetical protein
MWIRMVPASNKKVEGRFSVHRELVPQLVPPSFNGRMALNGRFHDSFVFLISSISTVGRNAIAYRGGFTDRYGIQRACCVVLSFVMILSHSIVCFYGVVELTMQFR